MRNRAFQFRLLLSVRTALYVLVVTDLFVAIRCGIRPHLPILVVPLLLTRLLNHSMVAMMSDSLQLPFYPIYGQVLGEMSDFEEMKKYVDQTDFLTMVLKNIATLLWIVLILEVYLTATGLVGFNPVLLGALLAGMGLMWAILRLRKRRASPAA